MGIILPGWICTSAATSHLLGIWCADHRACSLDECWAVWDSFRIEPLSWNSVLLITIEAFSSLWAMDLSGSVNISELREEGEKMGECFGGFTFDVFNSHLLSFGPSRWSLTGASASPKYLQLWWGRPVEKEQMPQPQPDAAANWARVLQSPARVKWCLAVLTTRRRKSLGAAVTLQLHWQYFCS